MKGYFGHFIKAVDNARNDEMQEHNRQSESPRRGQRAPPRKEIREIHMIFSGPQIAGSSRHTQDTHAREARIGPTIVVKQIEEGPNKAARRESEDITFTKREVRWVHHPYHDALVITTRGSNNNVHRILVDNGSVADILSLSAFNRMGLSHEYLRPIVTPLYGFTRDLLMP